MDKCKYYYLDIDGTKTCLENCNNGYIISNIKQEDEIECVTECIKDDKIYIIFHPKKN